MKIKGNADPFLAITLCVLGPSPGNASVRGHSSPSFQESKQWLNTLPSERTVY